MTINTDCIYYILAVAASGAGEVLRKAQAPTTPPPARPCRRLKWRARRSVSTSPREAGPHRLKRLDASTVTCRTRPRFERRENRRPPRNLWEKMRPFVSSQPVIASSAPASGRSPWMKRAIHSGRLARDERLHYFSFSVRKLPLDCFGTSLLAMTIQLDRRPLVAGANGGGIKAPPKPFSKLLQNSRVLLPSFPNKSLAVLWTFNGLQVFQTPFDAFQISRLRPPAFVPILPSFTIQFSRQRFHRGAATQIERILNLTDNPVFGKKYP